MIHENSSASFAESSEARGALESRVLQLMSDRKPRTDREIQYALEHSEPIRPRITQLVDAGLLHEVGSKRCQYTGKTVRLTERFL